jgi:ABC-type uncharacterized transport system permease subunit
MLKLEPRPQAVAVLELWLAVLALLITVVIGVLLFAALGKDPVQGPAGVFLGAGQDARSMRWAN